MAPLIVVLSTIIIGALGQDNIGEHSFPVPQIENVYKEWNPVNYGNPQKDDTTLFYSPPSLSEVRFISNSGFEERSAHVDGGGMGRIVIAATPKKKATKVEHSVYGWPDINYSELYEYDFHPYVRKRAQANRQELRKQQFESAHNSRSADDHTLLLKKLRPQKVTRTDYKYYTDPSQFQTKSEEKQIGQKKTPIITPPTLPESRPVEVSASLPGPPPPPPYDPQSEAVVYSFTNQYGQKQKVGVIYEDVKSNGQQQINQVFSSNKDVLSQNRRHQVEYQNAVQEVIKPIPLQQHRAETKDSGIEQNQYPLGTPFVGSRYETRPKFFPKQDHPPIYKVRPNRLEGSFGPPVPKGPTPTKIHFSPEAHPNYAQLDEQVPEQRANNSPVQSEQAEGGVVYKSVRDMDYQQPLVILRVKPSGELYRPDAEEGHVAQERYLRAASFPRDN